MIAKWIARAMLNGEDHLLLSIEELAKWQANGCRVSFGAPYGQFGGYAVQQVFKWAHELESLLLHLDPADWPMGEVKLTASGNSRSAYLPSHEYQLTESGTWRVPLIPADSSHFLDGWAFDIQLSAEELAALKPIAEQLAERCQPRCEIKSGNDPRLKFYSWNEGRIALARLGGRGPDKSVDDDMRREDERIAYWRSNLHERRLISKDNRYAHELQIQPKGLGYNLKIFSSLLSSWPDCEGLMKLDIQLSRSELVRMRSMIDESLGISVASLPDEVREQPFDIAQQVSDMWLAGRLPSETRSSRLSPIDNGEN